MEIPFANQPGKYSGNGDFSINRFDFDGYFLNRTKTKDKRQKTKDKSQRSTDFR